MTTANPIPSSQTIVSGLTREWTEDGAIQIFTFYNNCRATIDAWADCVVEIANTWPDDKPYYIIYDASRIFLTPYMRRRSEDIGKIERPHLVGYYAVVLPRTVIGHMFRLYLRRDMKRNYETHSGFFVSRDDAIAWLNQRYTA